jgi:hypothetical protein
MYPDRGHPPYFFSLSSITDNKPYYPAIRFSLYSHRLWEGQSNQYVDPRPGIALETSSF